MATVNHVTSRYVTVTTRCRMQAGCLARCYQQDCAAARTAGGPRPLLRANPYRVGRVQRQVRRAFIVKGSPLRIQALLAHCYPRSTTYARWQRDAVHRALRRFGKPLGRVAGRGGPMLWAPNCCTRVAQNSNQIRKTNQIAQ
jgi:hypothetical protein